MRTTTMARIKRDDYELLKRLAAHTGRDMVTLLGEAVAEKAAREGVPDPAPLDATRPRGT